MIWNQWYAVLPSKAVKSGKILAARRIGLELAFFRDGKGNVACVEDKCSHRGAALSGGKVKGNCIMCPFHGLEFDRNGACRYVPSYGKSSTIDLRRYNVKRYIVREEYGIVYLWYGDEEKVTEKLPFFHGFVDETYIYSEVEDLWNSHYSRCIENQLDVVHVPIVHHNTIGRGNKTLINGPKVIFENGMLITSANNEVDTGQKPRPAEDCIIKDTNLNFIFPNLWMNHISKKIKVIIYFAPVDDDNTILYIRFYHRITGNGLADRAIAFAGKYANLIVERQDKRVVITQKPKASSLKGGERLLTGDGPIIRYRQIREELKSKGKQAK